MDSIIRTIQGKTESLLKSEAKSWLDSSSAGVEKANVYLVPTLVGLLNKRIHSREEARETLALFEEEDMKKEWADQPDTLLDLFRRGDGAIPEKIKTIYQFIVQDEHPLVIRQLSSTGDINPQHLDKVLAFLSAITAAQVLRTLETESQKGRKLLSILKEDSEYIKIQTPSKLLELIKEEEVTEAAEAPPEDDQEESLDRPRAPLRPLLFFSLLFIGSLSILYWIKSPEMDNLAPMIQWHPAEPEQLPDQKIWQIAPGSSLTLEQGDPLNAFVSYFLQAKTLDSVRNFRLKAVSANPEDSLMPTYYRETLAHIKRLQQAQPHPAFHLSVTFTPGENGRITQALVDHVRAEIFRQLPVLAEGAPYAFVIQINKPQAPLRNRITPLPDQTEVRWSLSLDPNAFTR
jgi:hypothetical protein